MSNFYVGGAAPGFGIDALHHRLDLLVGAALVKVGEARLEHLLHGWFPEDWAGELLLKQVHHGLWCSARHQGLGGGVHVHRLLQRLHAGKHLIQRLRQSLLGGLHERGVKASAGFQHLGLKCAVLFRKFLEDVDGLLGPRTGETLREEFIRDLAHRLTALLLAGVFTKARQLGLLKAGDGEHGLLANGGSILHCLAAQADKLEPLLEGEGTSYAKSSILT
mmetsp:Transcript_95349/g.132441  ORF Transcript_95349/g.132441 Transcript_95349/m.132441 type:complete len:220 (+) Transcript_95349:32-691(+)